MERCFVEGIPSDQMQWLYPMPPNAPSSQPSSIFENTGGTAQAQVSSSISGRQEFLFRSWSTSSAPLSPRSPSPSSTQSLDGSNEWSDNEIHISDHEVEAERFSTDHETLSVEELSESDQGGATEAEIIRPDTYEDADSVAAGGDLNQGRDPQNLTQHHECIIEGFRKLGCHSEDDEIIVEKETRVSSKDKRWSAGVFKRSHSQSIGSDLDDEHGEPLDGHELVCSVRRLRRRIRGPHDSYSNAIASSTADFETEDGDSMNGVMVEGLPFSNVDERARPESEAAWEDAMDIT